MGFGCNGMGWGGWGSWGGHGIVGMILGAALWIGILAVLVIGIIWLVRQLGRRPQKAAGETALNAAKRRLAAGEITIGEFDEIAQRLATESAVVDR